MTSLNEMLQKCKNKESIRLCLQNKTALSDKVEILPGVYADVIIHGHPQGNGRKYLPTIVTVNCEQLTNYSKRSL